jgi:hypothetical protein
MTDSKSPHARMTRQARRISASSDSPLAPPKASPYVLDLLGLARHRPHADLDSII